MAATSRIGLRKLWFQIHKWIGLLLAIAVLPISVTGAALVWHDALDEAVNPKRYAVSGAATLAPSAYAAAAQAVLAPGERLSSIRMPEHGGPVIVTAAQLPKPGAGRPVRTMIWLDPPTARMLDKADSSEGLVRVLHALHGSLMIPGMGRQIVGWIGVAMLISSVSGLWLWWPTVGRWVRGLRWRRHNNFDTNLHHQLGFWIALPLFVLSLTGVWISFPPFFAWVSGAKAERAGPPPQARMRARPIETPVQAPDGVVAAARRIVPGTLVSISWPTDMKAEWVVSLAGDGAAPVEVRVVDVSGRAEPSRKPQGSGGIARTMRKIHDGTDMGTVWQVIIFLGGLFPAILVITGVIMWWRARGWRDALAERQVARRTGATAETA